ncbi:transglycosylase SLT domain-containing protein [Pseudomonas sp. 910_23]|uniref:transglycosylase SLT domain-containing protein n=1 Tax=Pseudomonas sp. 910_23 TaxID=2604461 RepID=UPI0040633E42
MANPTESPYRSLYAASGEESGVSPDLLERQGYVESRWNPKAIGPMTKYGQARGLSQFIEGTGKAYGLMTEEDFHNPEKSIPAQARYMADLKKRFGGSDELALAAYNMGPTALQRRIDKAGGIIEDVKLPAETRGYLKQIFEGKQSGWAADGTRAPSRINFGPTQAPIESAVDRVSGASPEELGTDSERSKWDAFTDGLQRSSIGSDIRSGRVTIPVTERDIDWVPTGDEIQKVKDAGIGEAGASFVFNHAYSGEDLDELIDIAKENRSTAAADGRQGVLTSLSGGLGEMLGDPVTYGAFFIPGGAQVGQLFNPGTARILAGAVGASAEGAAYGALTESLRETSTGVDADYKSAILAGAVGGAALHGVAVGVKTAFGKNNPMDSFRYVEDAETSKTLEDAGIIPEQRYQPGPLTSKVLKEDTYSPVARFSTIGERMRSSQNEDIRTAALGLFRNDKGYKDGTSGLGRMTGEEVKRNLDNEWFDVDTTYSRHAEEYIRSQRHTGLSNAELEDQFGYLVTLARETGNREGIPKGVSEAADLMGNFYDRRIGDVLTPSRRYGSGTDIVENPREWQGVENYSPVIMDTAKISRASGRVGGDDRLLEVAGRALYASLGNPQVRANAVKAYEDEFAKLAKKALKNAETPEAAASAQQVARKALDENGKLTSDFRRWALQKAKNQALGYVDQDMSRIKAHLYKTMDPAELPDFMRSRGIFRTDAEITLADGSKFNINRDLRSGDVRAIMHSYHKRTAGDLAMSVGLGDAGFRGFSERLSKIEQQIAKATRDDNPALKRQLNGDLNAMKIAAKKIYGMSLNQDGRGAADMLAGSLTNLSFVAKSAYMGPMNYTEISSGLANYGMGFFFKALPGVGEMFQRAARGKATADDLMLLQNRLWGEEIHDVVYPSHLHTSYAVAKESASSPVAAIFAGTSRLAQVAPSAKLLGATTNRIVKAAQEEFLATLVRHAHGSASKVFSPAKLKHMNVDPALFQKVLGHVKKSSKVGSKGQFSLNAARFLKGSGKDALEARQIVSEIRRMGDIAATDVIQRPSLGDTFIWADSKNPFIRFLTQFQTFSMRSLEKKFLKGVNRIRNGDIDEALQMSLSLGLSAIGTTGFAVVRAQTIRDEDKRREFYKNAMGYDSNTGKWDPATLAVAALKRSSYLAAPSMAYDTVGTPLGAPYAGLARTTRDTEELSGDTPAKAWKGLDIGDTFGNFPAVKYGTQMIQSGVAAGNLMRPSLDPEQVERQKKLILLNLKGLLPNDPATQTALSWLIAHGVEEP